MHEHHDHRQHHHYRPHHPQHSLVHRLLDDLYNDVRYSKNKSIPLPTTLMGLTLDVFYPQPFDGMMLRYLWSLERPVFISNTTDARTFPTPRLPTGPPTPALTAAPTTVAPDPSGAPPGGDSGSGQVSAAPARDDPGTARTIVIASVLLAMRI